MKKPYIDFTVLPNDDPRLIVIADASIWSVIKDKPAIIEITMPGAKKPSAIYEFKKEGVMMFNSKNLMTDCVDDSCKGYSPLDDGIYTITLKGSPDDFSTTKKYLHTANTRLKYDELLSKYFNNCAAINSKKLDKLKEIDFLIKAAESNTRICQYAQAQDLFFRAQKMIEGCKDVCS